MELSKHNILTKIKDSEKYIIVNLLSSQADILDAETAQAVLENKVLNDKQFIEKGYVVDPNEEQKLYKQRYLDFLDNRDSDELQIFFVPWYSCNFACTYCYQDEYTNSEQKIDDSVIDSFFDYVEKHFSQRRKYITIFGGEPLLDSPYHKKIISTLIEKSKERKLGVAIVTNGYNLSSYVDILRKGIIREVQVTLDGPEDIQNLRRPLRGGGESFGNIVKGINDALSANLPINLRVVIDKENLPLLPELSRFAKTQGWLDNPLLKTQLGRNYELHHCQIGNSKLFTRIEMYEDLFELSKKEPVILEFHRPAYSISRFLFDNGKLPDPLFDSCPGTKTEWAFDYTGSIYACTATVGKENEKLGKYYPTETLDQDTVDLWEERDVTTIPECKNCSQQLACGGGCASVAFNATGKIQSPDCRPVKELISLGISSYFLSEEEAK